MKKNPPSSIFLRFFSVFLSLLIPAGVVIIGLLMIYYRSETQTHLVQLKEQEEFSINLQSKIVDNVFDSMTGDLFFLSRQNELQEYLIKGDPASVDKMASEYLHFSAYKRIYDQIRFLDARGMEIVRIDYNLGRPGRIATDKLQSKEKRYYFQEAFQLEQGELFISPFDLNIEHDQIEQPLKPMIRLATPIVDASSRKRGIVVLNYLGSDLLKKLQAEEKVSPGRNMLLNADGYWLLSPDASQEWGFMFKDATRSFSSRYPDVWGQVRHQERGQILTADGLFTYKAVYPLKGRSCIRCAAAAVIGKNQEKINARAYHWYLVSFASQEVLEQFSLNLLRQLFSFGAGILLVSAIGSWVTAFAIIKRRIAQDQLKTMALYDALTDLPNRRLFYDRIQSVINQSRRYKRRFGLLFIDLDGFKKINDTLGHEAGDALLCEVAKRLRQCVRASDVVARLGGDEFVVIVDSLTADNGAQVVAQEIIDSLSGPMVLPQGEARIGASVGISLFPLNSEDGEELLRQADRAMYHSKYKGKNTFSLFSSELDVEDNSMS